jgi:succinate dehydrogenase/fumarate reductase cytochrome b subunit
MTQRITGLVLSVLVCVAAFLLSWPFWRTYAYWAESRSAWRLHFATGFVLVVYVFHVFIVSLRILFIHDAQELTLPAAAKPGAAADQGQRL